MNIKKIIFIVLFTILFVSLFGCSRGNSETDDDELTSQFSSSKETATTTTTLPTSTTTLVQTTEYETTIAISATTTTTPVPVVVTTTPTPVITQPPTPTNPPTTQTLTPPQTDPPPTNPPPTQPPAPAFDPQVYVDYAIEYGQSIGLEHKPTLGNYPNWGGDKPMENANWNQPMHFSPKMTAENMKRDIRDYCLFLLEINKAKYFRVEVYKATDLDWLTPDYENAYLLFFFYARN